MPAWFLNGFIWTHEKRELWPPTSRMEWGKAPEMPLRASAHGNHTAMYHEVIMASDMRIIMHCIVTLDRCV